MSSFRQLLISGVAEVQISDVCFVHLLSQYFYKCCNQLDSNLEDIVEVGQISQCSVETLFRGGGNGFHDFAANLFRKLYTKFHQNCPSFVEDITKTFWSVFFLDTVYLLLCMFKFPLTLPSNNKNRSVQLTCSALYVINCSVHAAQKILSLNDKRIIVLHDRPTSR